MKRFLQTKSQVPVNSIVVVLLLMICLCDYFYFFALMYDWHIRMSLSKFHCPVKVQMLVKQGEKRLIAVIGWKPYML
jgi:hypothetical protein